MKGYAYITTAGVLHISADKGTAIERAAKVVETEVPFAHGYPVIDGKNVIMYGLDEVYHDGNINSGKLITVNDYAELGAVLELYKACM